MTLVTLAPPEDDTERPPFWSLLFRYDPEIIETIKAVPAHSRQWDPARKLWHIEEFWLRTVETEILNLGHQAVGAPTSDTTSRAAPPSWATPSWAEILLDAVGPERRALVVGALEAVLDPEQATGSAELFGELRTAVALADR